MRPVFATFDPHPMASQFMPDAPALSVVIPTRDRHERLAETLEALAREASRGDAGIPSPSSGGAPDFEVLVVDDGSAPGHHAELESRRWPFALRWSRQEAVGPAAARNLGVREARGERILFLGDDTRPAPGCLDRHLAIGGVADGEAVGIQGHIDWDPDQPVSEVMAFLAPAGPQFYFAGLEPGAPVPYTAVLGSNASFPRAWLLAEPYDEGFPAAALEDTEQAYRFERRDWRTLYDPQALCWHHHPYPELAPFLARQRRAGRAARHALRRQPALFGKVVLQPLLMAGPVFLLGTLRALARRPGASWRRVIWDLRCRLAFGWGWIAG